MTLPKRVRWNRFNGPLPAGAKSVMRPSRWGNMFVADRTRSRAQAVASFVDYLQQRGRGGPDPYGYPSVAQIRDQLAGWDLACACPLDGPCHADVLLAIAAEVWTPGQQPYDDAVAEWRLLNDCQQVAEVLAVNPRPLHAWEIGLLAGLDHCRTLAALERLENTRRVDTDRVPLGQARRYHLTEPVQPQGEPA